MDYDAGNYVDLVDKSKDPTVALVPSAILNFNPATIANLFPGFLILWQTKKSCSKFYASSRN